MIKKREYFKKKGFGNGLKYRFLRQRVTKNEAYFVESDEMTYFLKKEVAIAILLIYNPKSVQEISTEQTKYFLGR